MFPQKLLKMADHIKFALNMNKARAVCFAAACLTAIEAKSVMLSDVACRLPGKATPNSRFRRLQRFYNEIKPDFKKVALLIMSLIGKADNQEPLLLAIDRTNWKSRGNAANLLTLSICAGDVGIPLFWKDLRCKGNSNTQERARLVHRFAAFFGARRIGCLVGDREFIGKQWFSWMISNDIPFVMRLKENMRLVINCRNIAAKHCFHQLAINEFLDLGIQTVCGVDLHICGLKTKSGKLIILGSHGISSQDAADTYLRRWNIETGFEKLKEHGFNLEDTRLRGKGKMELLLAILGISMAWSYSCGQLSAKAIRPIKLKSHGRKEKSLFRLGLDFLCSWLLGLSNILPILIRKATSLFYNASTYVASIFPT
jgi:hypothetical protein